MKNDQTLRRYFLGELPRHQQRLIEKSFFEDDELFDRLLSTEEQLIGDYVRGALPERERERFESYFLATPQRKQRVKEVAEAAVVIPAPPPVVSPDAPPLPKRGLLLQIKGLWDALRGSRTMLQVSFAVLALAFFGGLWAAIDTVSRRPAQPAAGPSETPPGTRPPQVAVVRTPPPPGIAATPPDTAPTPAPSPTPFPAPAPGRQPRPPGSREGQSQPSLTPSVAAVLTPGLLRGASPTPTVELRPDTPNVLLQASLIEQKFDLYSATLLDEERHQVRHWRARSPRGKGKDAAVVFDLPAGRLSAGYYYLILYGIDPAGGNVKVDTYPFEVQRQ